MRRHLDPSVPHAAARTTLKAATEVIRQRDGHLVHAHMTAAEAAAVVTRPLTHARVVATRHFAGGRSRGLLRPVAGLIARGLSVEIAISEFVASSYHRRTEVILNGVPETEAQSDPERRVVLVMQRLEPEKRTDLALRAWRLADLGSRGWKLVVAGRGSQAAALRRLAQDLDIMRSVEFRGFVDAPASCRAEASVFLATAPAEPFGLAVVEAMAAGMTVLATDGGAHRETVADAGLLFDPDDVHMCAEALRSAAESTAFRAACGARARERQRAVLTLDRHVEALEQTYLRVLNTRS